ncbi:uncharacterized protein K02A2.6-like [Dermacentor silvarum]|uniref:uncharacterized protein K02A2.6-like n=1 Tax=Dermacentor silvarum TaxID=543639 RepID=UPI002100F027|nr:uncharacterized protein K02A2.6-like [Dermacentor silvarum]
MAAAGKFEPFLEDGDEDFESYIERFEHFLRATQVSDDLKVSVLITAIGKKTYRTLKNLLAPMKPEEKEYAPLIQALKKHYAPEPMVIAERFQFNRRIQQDTEPVAGFALELKSLAASCNFGAFLDEALRDRFVAGLKDEITQAELLKRATLTFAEACELARSIELARSETKKFQPEGQQLGVQAVQRQTLSSRSGQPRGDYMETRAAKETTGWACYRCGATSHTDERCPFRKYRCRACKRVGHLARVCRSSGSTAHYAEDSSGEDNLLLQNVFSCNESVRNYTVNVRVGGRNVPMQIDTGASVSIVPETLYQRHWAGRPLLPCSIKLKAYGGTPLAVLGKLMMPVEHNNQTATLPLIVVRTLQKSETALLGRNWLESLKLDWLSVGRVAIDRVASLLERFSEVFEPELGQIPDCQVSLLLKDGTTPVFCKPRPVPFALRDPVSQQLRAWQNAGVIVPVLKSDWATPLVVVPKGDKTVRICGDYRMTVNPCLRTDHYPLPVMEDLFVALHGCKYFTVLDLSTAYQQLQLHPDSQSLLTINTHMGLFKFTRLPYGITSAPSIFQAVMDDVLGGLDRVACYLDDVLIAGESFEESWKKVESVLTRFKERGIKLRKEKCKFFQTSVAYLGHVLDGNGIRPSDKVRAIKDAPTPKNKQELRAYLGMLNFYAKLIPNMSAELKPFYELLGENVKWKWTDRVADTFKRSKDWLMHPRVLTYYNPDQELGMVCDASAYGLGAILFHKIAGVERPIAFASRTLSQAEQGYAHLENHLQ